MPPVTPAAPPATDEECQRTREMDTFIQEAALVAGPQDGARVEAVGGKIPQVIYVGPRWLGDGFSAWSAEWSVQFPACYVLVGYNYRFKGNKPWVRP